MKRSAYRREYDEVRNVLIKARNASGKTQKTVATWLGSPQSYVSKY